MTSAENWSQKYLRYEFLQPALLQQALTHRSYSAENNERLEFLGDAVLGAVIAEALYQQEDAADEGTLTRLRASLVRGETLADIAAEMQLGNRLLLGGGEARTGGHQKRSFLEGGLKAVFGAVFLDGGFAAARAVILQIFAPRLADARRSRPCSVLRPAQKASQRADCRQTCGECGTFPRAPVSDRRGLHQRCY